SGTYESAGASYFYNSTNAPMTSWTFSATTNNWQVDTGVSYPYLYYQVWNWTGSGDGTTWSNSSNWSNSEFTGYPSNLSAKAVINTGSGSISTPSGSALTIGSLMLGSSYSGTLTLGN